MKTALEWLADELKKNHGIDLRLYDEFNQAKEMEEQLKKCKCGNPIVGGYSCRRTDCNQTKQLNL